MKVKLLKTGDTITVNASYGARLIEQGEAVGIEEKSKPSNAKKETAVKPAGDA